jgi:hypothetical protein
MLLEMQILRFHPTDEDLSVGTPISPHGRRPVRGDPDSAYPKDR